MTDTTLEEAKRCPKCNEPGEETGSKPLRTSETRGARLLDVFCRNSRCSWYNTPWVIQVNPDGTVPPPNMNREKRFPKLDPVVGERVIGNLERQLEAEQRGDAEIRSR